MLSAVPQMMVDRVIEMMRLAELELQIMSLVTTHYFARSV